MNDARPSRSVLVTGATGLVGSAVLSRLVAEPDLAIHVLVRPGRDASPPERLAALGRYLGRPDLADRVVVHAGDVALPRLGLGAQAAARLAATTTDVIHAAAAVALDPDDPAVLAANVLGTRHVLELFAPHSRLFLVSTAYVAGLCPDVFREADLDVGQAFRNAYERSKFDAERLVRAAYLGAAGSLTVCRPSIVVGEYATGRALKLMNLYQMLRLLAGFAQRHPGAEFALEHDPESTQNYIPVDCLAAMIHEVFTRPACWGQTYHMVNDGPVRNADFRAMLEAILPIRIVNRAPTASDPAFNHAAVRRSRDYLAYLRAGPRFHCANRDRLGSAAAPMAFSQAFLERLLRFGTGQQGGRHASVDL